VNDSDDLDDAFVDAWARFDRAAAKAVVIAHRAAVDQLEAKVAELNAELRGPLAAGPWQWQWEA
jgi:hypothetical protein